MIVQQLPPFVNVVASGKATMRVPKYALTLNRITLVLGGTTFTIAMITDITIKIGTRVVYNVTGTVLDAINRYKGLYNQAGFLSIDFTERDAPTVQGKEIGCYDLSTFVDDLFIEVTIAGATAPTLDAFAEFTPPQKNPLIAKTLAIPFSGSVAGKLPINWNPQGALIKRLHFRYAGTDWTTTTNGNLNKVELKKNGLVLWEPSDLVNRFKQQEYRKVPQSRMFTLDMLMDNNANGHLVTRDAQSLEINPFFTAADSGMLYVEILDQPNNN